VAFQRLERNFNNLASFHNWYQLYVHLHGKTSWPSQNSLTIHELHHNQIVLWTKLLLHALTPIRLAFVDGQARIMAVSFFLEQTIPLTQESHLKLREHFDLTPDTEEEQLSPSQTTNKENLTTSVTTDMIIMTPKENDIDQLLDDFLKMSHSVCVNSEAAEPFNLWDGILNLRRPLERLEKKTNKQPWNLEDNTDYFRNYFYTIFYYVRHFMLGPIPLTEEQGLPNEVQPNPQQQQFNELTTPNKKAEQEFKMIIADNRKSIFPRLASWKKDVHLAPYQVLIQVLAALLASDESRQYIDSLINNHWRGVKSALIKESMQSTFTFSKVCHNTMFD
jgi:hypothetical protein